MFRPLTDEELAQLKRNSDRLHEISEIMHAEKGQHFTERTKGLAVEALRLVAQSATILTAAQ